jgi:hypothetical protein
VGDTGRVALRLQCRVAAVRSNAALRSTHFGNGGIMRERTGTAAAVVIVTGALLALLLGAEPAAQESGRTKTETFDRDPGWDHLNNRPADRGDQPVTIRQDFGYSAGTSHAGGKPGEVGGFLQAAAEPAFYGKVLPDLTLDQPFSASGTLSLADGGTHLLLGFFNAGTVNEWRTPNTVSIRINGRGERFFAYVEYCTSTWRAGGDSPTPFPTAEDPKTGRKSLVGFASGGKVHRWSLKYDPAANGGAGAVTATIDDRTAVCHLDDGHKADGATFNRFGLLNVLKSADNGADIFLDDVTVNGQADSFDADPKWDGKNNRTTFATQNVRPRFDFGFSPTHFAGGKAAGELGGLFFRGDCRYPKRIAYYADRVGPLSLDKSFKASGKVTMTRGVSDSTTLFGFFNLAAATRQNPSQNDGIPEGVLGVNIEGPSREGFYFYPVSRPIGRGGSNASGGGAPRIMPDGKAHDWTFSYDPAGANGRGRITTSLDGKSVSLDLSEGDKTGPTRLDHFGLVTPWIDGNGQNVYFDDVTYTVRQ